MSDDKKSLSEYPVLIIGAGPAGLTAAYELSKRRVNSLVLEKDSIVGGISRTESYKGYRFDIGGHRFFTKVDRVMDMWKEVLGGDFLKRPRLSHIYYKGQFFLYPLKPFDVFKKLGLKETFLAGLSFLRAQIFKRPKEESFEDYIINHFGERLYLTFFKSYTEKVWGIPCSQIKAEWAAQRIKDLSVSSLIKTMLFGNRGNKIKTLIEEFYYPRLGPGMMWERVKELNEKSGHSRVLYNSFPSEIKHDGENITEVIYSDRSGKKSQIKVSSLISSMPIAELFSLFSPELSEEALLASKSLHYRDFMTVALIINKPEMFPDNWIYIHEPLVNVGRIQNFKNWSPELVPDQNKTCLGLEYFCFKNDKLWNMEDADMIEMAKKELVAIGLAKYEDIQDGKVIRMEKTYPVYDDAYEAAMPVIKDAVAQFKNLYLVGRNGMHKYNNQDHAMLTAMLAVENILDNAGHDLWEVNVDRVYHEEK